jgi:hypothetical protein
LRRARRIWQVNIDRTEGSHEINFEQRRHLLLAGTVWSPSSALIAARMPSFAVSICVLSAAQAAVVALPGRHDLPRLNRLRSGWWAIVPVASVVAFVFAVRALDGVADGLTYLALLAVPPLAALGVAFLIRGARPRYAAGAAALFALAWADRQGLAGETAALVLDACSCVTLGVLLVAVTPARLVKLAIVAMAAVDTWLVASDLLTAPNNSLNAVAPVAHLPELQRVLFGSAVMGYGDLFIAGLLGALLAFEGRGQWRAALLAATLALLSNLLFFVLNELPATVPIALTLIAIEAAKRRGTRRVRARPPESAP